MASADTKFSHITVHADDDDEFVIQAGARTPESAATAPEPGQGAEPDREPEASAPQDAEGAPVVASADERQAVANDAADRSEPQRARAKEYRPTTAEDLEATPMSAMQKAIIAIALLCVVGSVAYCMFFMR